MLAGNPKKKGRLPVVPIVPIVPIVPAAISPAAMPVVPSPARVPVVPVTPPHWLSVRRGGIALVGFSPQTLTELFLNLLNTNLQLLSSVRFRRAGTGSCGIHGRSRAQHQ